MKVISTVGIYAGQERDFPPHVAKMLLERGHAKPIGEAAKEAPKAQPKGKQR